MSCRCAVLWIDELRFVDVTDSLGRVCVAIGAGVERLVAALLRHPSAQHHVAHHSRSLDRSALSGLRHPDSWLICPSLRPSRERQGGKNGGPPWLLAPGGKRRKVHVYKHFGVLAQLVERLNGIEEVRGSNPLGSTFLIFSALRNATPTYTNNRWDESGMEASRQKDFK